MNLACLRPLVIGFSLLVFAEGLVDGKRLMSAQSNEPGKQTEHVGHNSWSAAYASSDVYDWMLQQTKEQQTDVEKSAGSK